MTTDDGISAEQVRDWIVDAAFELRKYPDRNIDLAYACLIRLAEELGQPTY